MKNIDVINTKRIAIILILVSLFVGASIAKTASNKEIDSYVQRTMKQHQIPGVALAVIKDGRVIHRNYYGLANVEHNVSVTDKTVFRIFSTTKLMVATGVFQLIESGQVGLEDEVSKYVDGLPKHWQAVTVKQLLAFASGLPQIRPGKTEKEMAEAACSVYRELVPAARASAIEKTVLYYQSEDRRRMADGMRQAGLPE